MQPNTSYIESRLKNQAIIEKILRDFFQSKFEELFKNNSKVKVLSVSTGDASWDYCLLKTNNNISKLTATDIIDYGISEKDKHLLENLGIWEFKLVEPEASLDFPKNSFDFIYHFDVIEHVNNPYRFLKSQYEVLNDSGYILIYTPNLFRPLNVVRLLTGNLKFPKLLGKDNTYGDCLHIQEFYSGSLKNLLSEIGFKEIEIIEVLFGLPNFQISKFPKNSITKSLSHGLIAIAKK